MRKILGFLVVVAVAAAGTVGWVKTKPCSAPPQLVKLVDPAAPACPAPQPKEAQAQDVPPPAVTVIVADKRPFVDRLFLSGTLVPREEALVSAQIDGLSIVQLDAEDGDRVKAGQVLARLDRSQLDALMAQSDAAIQRSEAAVQQAQAAIDQAQAQVNFNNDDLDRAEKLGSQVIAASTIEQRRTAVKTAQAQLESAQHALSVAKADRLSRDAERKELLVRIARTDVKAPVDGIVSRRTAKLGATAAGSGDPLFRIIKDGAIDLEADVPEQSIARLAVDMPAKLTVPGMAKPVEGKVRLVNQEIDKASRTGKVRIAIDPSAAAHIGAFASGDVTLATSEGLGVPSTAVERDAGGAEVLLVKDDVVTAAKVKLGIVEGDWVEIVDGLSAGDKVVARAAAFLRPGDRVRPIVATTALAN